MECLSPFQERERVFVGKRSDLVVRHVHTRLCTKQAIVAVLSVGRAQYTVKARMSAGVCDILVRLVIE